MKSQLRKYVRVLQVFREGRLYGFPDFGLRRADSCSREVVFFACLKVVVHEASRPTTAHNDIRTSQRYSQSIFTNIHSSELLHKDIHSSSHWYSQISHAIVTSQTRFQSGLPPHRQRSGEELSKKVNMYEHVEADRSCVEMWQFFHARKFWNSSLAAVEQPL